MRNPFPRGNGFSIGSCEIPGVLTRAIYHARSVFAYVVKGPCVAYALGHRRSRVPFEIRVFANTLHTHTHTHAHPSVSPYLFISALPQRFCLATLVAKNPRVVRPPNFLSSHLTLFRLSARHRGPLWLSFIRRDYSRSSSLLLTCKSSKVMHTQVRCA